MKVFAQSQPSVSLHYVHLAYISGQLQNRISKGELLPVQAVLGVAVAAAVGWGFWGAKSARTGRGGRAALLGGVLGSLAALSLLGLLQVAWSKSRSHEQVVSHVIETKQFWALRESQIAADIEAAATTNGAAAALAAKYYDLKWAGGEKTPEFAVRAFRYWELAVAQGNHCDQLWLAHLTKSWPEARLKKEYQAALETGKLSESERAWTKQQLARMVEPVEHEDRVKAKP